jgi:hypothetical protein
MEQEKQGRAIERYDRPQRQFAAILSLRRGGSGQD